MWFLLKSRWTGRSLSALYNNFKVVCCCWLLAQFIYIMTFREHLYFVKLYSIHTHTHTERNSVKVVVKCVACLHLLILLEYTDVECKIIIIIIPSMGKGCWSRVACVLHWGWEVCWTASQARQISTEKPDQLCPPTVNYNEKE